VEHTSLRLAGLVEVLGAQRGEAKAFRMEFAVVPVPAEPSEPSDGDARRGSVAAS
jgi:hypothetical protein